MHYVQIGGAGWWEVPRVSTQRSLTHSPDNSNNRGQVKLSGVF
jgi:hypothetical protein